jgi:hypothetical protein
MLVITLAVFGLTSNIGIRLSGCTGFPVTGTLNPAIQDEQDQG